MPAWAVKRNWPRAVCVRGTAGRRWAAGGWGEVRRRVTQAHALMCPSGRRLLRWARAPTKARQPLKGRPWPSKQGSARHGAARGSEGRRPGCAPPGGAGCCGASRCSGRPPPLGRGGRSPAAWRTAPGRRWGGAGAERPAHFAWPRASRQSGCVSGRASARERPAPHGSRPPDACGSTALGFHRGTARCQGRSGGLRFPDGTASSRGERGCGPCRSGSPRPARAPAPTTRLRRRRRPPGAGCCRPGRARTSRLRGGTPRRARC
jgi:hypothetical protein